MIRLGKYPSYLCSLWIKPPQIFNLCGKQKLIGNKSKDWLARNTLDEPLCKSHASSRLTPASCTELVLNVFQSPAQSYLSKLSTMTKSLKIQYVQVNFGVEELFSLKRDKIETKTGYVTTISVQKLQWQIRRADLTSPRFMEVRN